MAVSRRGGSLHTVLRGGARGAAAAVCGGGRALVSCTSGGEGRTRGPHSATDVVRGRPFVLVLAAALCSLPPRVQHCPFEP